MKFNKARVRGYSEQFEPTRSNRPGRRVGQGRRTGDGQGVEAREKTELEMEMRKGGTGFLSKECRCRAPLYPSVRDTGDLIAS